MITVLYFAAVRDLAGVAQERIDFTGPVRALAKRLAELHPALDGRLGQVRFAVNEVFVDDDDVVAAGDVVALIPPVAGG